MEKFDVDDEIGVRLGKTQPKVVWMLAPYDRKVRGFLFREKIKWRWCRASLFCRKKSALIGSVFMEKLM